MDESVILHAERSFLVCRNPVGVECEHELPALLAEEVKCKVDSLYCVHRLDRAVGGVMVWARTPKAAAELSRQVQEKALKKAYFAVCSGIPTPDTGEMRDLLFKDSVKQKSFAVSSFRRGVKEALLDYRVLQTAALNGSPAALVRVTLHTGRFHQIRCQFATRGHPLLGDGKYGSRIKGDIALQSARLRFIHPDTGKEMDFRLPVPGTWPAWGIRQENDNGTTV